MTDTEHFREGDAVYAHGGASYIDGEIVSIEDVPEMSDDELQELHDNVMRIIHEKGGRSNLYDMLVVVNGEFIRRE
jgi:hypothetical protein